MFCERFAIDGKMEDDEFDEQLATLDLDITNTSHYGIDENANQAEKVIIKSEKTPPFRLPADNLDDDFSDEQLATIDLAVAECIHRNDVPANTMNEPTGEDLFGNFTETQFVALDRSIEQHNRQPNANEITESQFELLMAGLDGDDENEPNFEHLECLRSKFKHSQFRTKQWEIIRTVMIEKRDVCAVMATGYGKSLCFQYPAVFMKGTVLVIAPLISLMQQQVSNLNRKNISACYLGSAQPDKQIVQRIKGGRDSYRLIYCSPEFLQSYQGKTLLHALKNRFTLIAIDGMHFSFSIS